MIDKLADLPLVYHPGNSREYSVATDVVGRLVEILAKLNRLAYEAVRRGG